MPTEITSILTAIEKQGERAERLSRDQMTAINGLASEMRDFGASVAKGLGRSQASNGNGNNWMQLGVGSSIVFGLFTSMLIMVLGISSNATEHSHLEGHPFVIAKLAAFEVALKEIETQFRAVLERITLEHQNQDNITANIIKSMDLDNEREESDIASRSRDEHRISVLERKVFGQHISISPKVSDIP